MQKSTLNGSHGISVGAIVGTGGVSDGREVGGKDVLVGGMSFVFATTGA